MSDFPIDGLEEVNQHHVPNKFQNLSLLELFVGIYKKFSFMGKKFKIYIICKTKLTMPTTVTTDILQQTWQETEYGLDVCSTINCEYTAIF
jgi:hypothetical protein